MSLQAVILAAGKGSRLHPITTTRSKAMLPILGKPIVERVMQILEINGIDKFILVISPDDRDIRRHFQNDANFSAEVHFVTQPQQLGMADALRCAAPMITGDFVLSACDNLIPGDFITRMLDRWQASPRPNAILTLMEVRPEQISSVGIVKQNNGWIIQIVEKPAPEMAPSNIASLPLYCLPYKILEFLPEIRPSVRGEYELQDALQLLIDRCGKVLGLQVENRLTLTRPADILTINRHFLGTNDIPPQLQPQSIGENTTLITPLFIESGTRIGKNCVIGPNVYIERDCQICEDVHIRDSIVLEKATLPAGTRIVDQIIYQKRS